MFCHEVRYVGVGQKSAVIFTDVAMRCSILGLKNVFSNGFN